MSEQYSLFVFNLTLWYPKLYVPLMFSQCNRKYVLGLGSSHKVFEWLPSGHLAPGPSGEGQRVQEATAVETLEAQYSVNTADYSQHQTSAETHTLNAHTQRSDRYLKDTLFRGH